MPLGDRRRSPDPAGTGGCIFRPRAPYLTAR
jgi:hypothetical protein